jgi:hypothetical protein
MRVRGRAIVCGVLLAGLAALAGCHDADLDGKHTAVLGGSGPQAEGTTGDSEAIPPPPAPAAVQPQVVRSGDEAAVAIWVDGGNVFASSWKRASGWVPAQPLERIYGESGDARITSNGRGSAMAVWHHTVGNIHSLRYSRFDGSAWTRPDVLPGALPRPAVAGTPQGQVAPRLQMDEAGNVLAQWPSGFRANEMQVARYRPGQGWSEAASEPVASAPGASPPPPAASAAR